MATFELKMEGIDELEKDLKEAMEEYPQEMKKGLNRIANDFRKSARARTPDNKHHKGNPKKKLKRCYNKWAFAEDDKVGVLIYNNAPHFHLVERGHNLVRGDRVIGFVPGRHMMEKTANEYEDIVPERLEKLCDETLRRHDL